MIKFIKENKVLTVILIISLILHMFAIINLGANYNIGSDDLSYINSGIEFSKSLTITMHNEYPSAQIMPGLTYLIGLLSLIFKGNNLYLVLKIIYMIISLFSIIGVNKTIKVISPNYKYINLVSSLCTIPLLTPSFIWMDNLILTETPFMCSFIFLIYYTLKISEEKTTKNFILIIIFYLVSVFLKANIALYPLFLVGYLVLKKYDTKLLIKQVLIGICVIGLFFIPWIYRNYSEFNKFIPLTYGSGNPLLMGTYEGYGFPKDEELDYDNYVLNHASKDLINYIENKNTDHKMDTYYTLEIDKLKAELRINTWFKTNPKSMLISYFIIKPLKLIEPFYWDNVFNISFSVVIVLRKIVIIVAGLSFIYIFLNKKINLNIMFLLFNLVFEVIVYSYTFTFSRYGQTLMFILFIIIGYSFNTVFNKFTRKGA